MIDIKDLIELLLGYKVDIYINVLMINKKYKTAIEYLQTKVRTKGEDLIKYNNTIRRNDMYNKLIYNNIKYKIIKLYQTDLLSSLKKYLYYNNKDNLNYIYYYNNIKGKNIESESNLYLKLYKNNWLILYIIYTINSTININYKNNLIIFNKELNGGVESGIIVINNYKLYN